MATKSIRCKPPTKKPLGRPRLLAVVEERRKILDAAHRVFAASGFTGATIGEIARQANVQRPNVYAHFGPKDGLIEACVEDAGELVFQALTEGFELQANLPWQEMVRQCYAVIFSVIATHHDALNVLFQADHSQKNASATHNSSMKARHRVLTKLTQHVRDQLQLGGVVGPVASEMLAQMLYGMSWMVAEQQILQNWDKEALIDVLTDFTCGGLSRLWRHELAPLKALDRPRIKPATKSASPRGKGRR